MEVSCPEPWLYRWLDKKSALGEGVLYARRHRVEGRRHPLSVFVCARVFIPEESREMIGISSPITVKGLPEALHWLE